MICGNVRVPHPLFAVPLLLHPLDLRQAEPAVLRPSLQLLLPLLLLLLLPGPGRQLDLLLLLLLPESLLLLLL